MLSWKLGGSAQFYHSPCSGPISQGTFRRGLNYYERSLQLLRPGGLIAVDNTLWGSLVADKENTEVDVRAIRRFNQTIFNDKPITLLLVPIGDGLTLAGMILII